jgi:hypothetical protein
MTVPAPLRDTSGVGIRARFLQSGGGRIGRAEVRERAGKAMARNLPSVLDCPASGRTWAIVGGGPSIARNVAAIRTLKRQGANIVSVNKSHDWLLERGIVPWGHVLLDPKDWVAHYVKRPRKDVRYFLASQCHDDTFDALKDYPVFLWHAGQDFDEGPEPNGYLRASWPRRPWYVVPGGTTVGLRAVQLGHAMGVDRFHLFGLDSSRAGGRLHAYAKDEAADAESGTLSLRFRGKKYVFDTNSHMARQQMDFDKFIEDMPQNFAAGRLRRGFEITVHGEGLLPFFAAMIGLHADSACNADPARVGGYVDVIAEECEAENFFAPAERFFVDENSRISDKDKYTVPLPRPVL